MNAGIRESARELLAGVPCDALLAGERPLLCAGPGEPLEAAVNRMWWRRVGALPVVHEGRLVGCFAEEDLVRALATRLREVDGEPLAVWRTLLADACVRDAMTPVSKLPVVTSADTLLDGLRQCCAPAAPRGRYLFLVDDVDADRARGASGGGDARDDEACDHVRLASFRDVARFLTDLYAGRVGADGFASEDAFEAASRACRKLLSRTVGELREAGLGHPPNLVDPQLDGAATVEAMVEGGRGYALVTLPDAGPIGICTRRDVLRGVRPRHADLGRLRLAELMSPDVRTVTDTNTLCGLLHLMALASCRHMPLVDAWDRVECVISMWEAIALVAGEEPQAS